MGPPHHHNVPMVPLPMGAPPPVTNGFGPHGHSGPPPRLDLETEIAHSHSMPPPNMAEPPPNMVPAPPYPPPHLQHPLLLPPMVGPPPPVLLSPAPTSPPLYSNPSQEEQSRRSSEEQLEMDISNMSISDSHPPLPNQSIVEPEQPPHEEQLQQEQQPDTAEQQLQVQLSQQQLTKDLFNLYSLSFVCKSKDLSERRIRLDFGLVAEVRLNSSVRTSQYPPLLPQVSRIRGQLGRADSPVIVSFETREDCVKCLQEKILTTKVWSGINSTLTIIPLLWFCSIQPWLLHRM